MNIYIGVLIIIGISCMIVLIYKQITTKTEHLGTYGDSYRMEETNNMESKTCGTTKFVCPKTHNKKKIGSEGEEYYYIDCSYNKNQECDVATCCNKKKYCISDTDVCKNGYVYKSDANTIACMSTEDGNPKCIQGTCCEVPQINYLLYENRIPGGNIGGSDFNNDSTNTSLDNHGESKKQTVDECKDICSLGQENAPNCVGFLYNNDNGYCKYYTKEELKSIEYKHRLRVSKITDVYKQIDPPSDLYVTDKITMDAMPTTCSYINCDNKEDDVKYEKDNKQECKNEICSRSECCIVPKVKYNEYKNAFVYKDGVQTPYTIIKKGFEAERSITAYQNKCRDECSLRHYNKGDTKCEAYDFNILKKECRLYNKPYEYDPKPPGDYQSRIQDEHNIQILMSTDKSGTDDAKMVFNSVPDSNTMDTIRDQANNSNDPDVKEAASQLLEKNKKTISEFKLTHCPA